MRFETRTGVGRVPRLHVLRYPPAVEDAGVPEVDVDALMMDIRRSVSARRAAGLSAGDPATIELDAQDALVGIRQAAVIAGDRDVMRSSKPIVGPVITLGRRLTTKLVSPLIGDLFAKSNRFNSEAVGVLQRLSDELETERQRVIDLEARVADLDARQRARE